MTNNLLSSISYDLYTLFRVCIIIAGFVSFSFNARDLRRSWGRFDYRFYLRVVVTVISLVASLLYISLLPVVGVPSYGPYIGNSIILLFLLVSAGRAILDAS